MNQIVPNNGVEPNTKVAREFWERFGGPDLLLTCIWPDGGKPLEAFRGTTALKQAVKLNQAGYNIYFTPNRVNPVFAGKKPRKADITEIRTVYADIDWDRKKFKGDFPAGFAEVVNKCSQLMAMPQPPTLVIYTGGGIQPIWSLEALPNTAENTQLAEATSRDRRVL